MLLVTKGTRRLQRSVAQSVDPRSCFALEPLRVREPQISRSCEPLISTRLQYPMFLAAHLVNRVAEVFHDVELVEDDLLVCPGQMSARGSDVRRPHVHRNTLDHLEFLRVVLRPERVETGLVPVIDHL